MTDIRFPRASNRGDWHFWLEAIDPRDGQLLDLPADYLTLQVHRMDGCGPILTAAPGDGKVTAPVPGVLEVLFRAAEMKALCPDTYLIGAIIFDGTDTAQAIIGSVPVYYGGVN